MLLLAWLGRHHSCSSLSGSEDVSHRIAADPASRLLFMVEVRCNKLHWNSAFVLNPMGTRPKLGKDLSGVKLFRRAVIMVVGQHTGQQVDDSGIVAMAVQTDMTAGRNHRAA